MTTVIYGAFVPALILGHLYVGVLLAVLFLRLRRSKAVDNEAFGDDAVQQEAGPEPEQKWDPHPAPSGFKRNPKRTRFSLLAYAVGGRAPVEDEEELLEPLVPVEDSGIAIPLITTGLEAGSLQTSPCNGARAAELGTLPSHRHAAPGDAGWPRVMGTDPLGVVAGGETFVEIDVTGAAGSADECDQGLPSGSGSGSGSDTGTRSGSGSGRRCRSPLAGEASCDDMRIFNPVALEWDNVAVSFTNSKGRAATVLHGQCGRALPGEVLVIMGPSGAGKSTLLDVLSARALRGGRVSGRVLVNGRRVSGARFVRLRAYVPQEDHFVASLTALETVTLHASLDLPAGTPAEVVAGRAQEVLRVMGLSQQQHTLVGGVLPGGMPLRGLSGGQKRRLNIACRIVAAPPVVFLDEPTSGLDSTAALKVMTYMKLYASRCHTIIATLHQPRGAIWSLLDKVLFLALGRLMYLGTPGDVVPWFSGVVGFPYDATLDGLPSDWLMDILAVDMAIAKKDVRDGRPSAPSRTRSNGPAAMRRRLKEAAEQFVAEYHRRHQQAETLAACRGRLQPMHQGGSCEFTFIGAEGGVDGEEHDRASRTASSAEGGKGVEEHDGGTAAMDLAAQGPPTPSHRITLRAWLHQMWILMKREGLMITRNPADAAGRMGTCMYVAVMQGLVFLALTRNGTSYQIRLACIFTNVFGLMQLPFISMGLTMSDSWLLVREAAEHLYSPSACFVARQVVNTVVNAANAIVYTTTTYGLAGLRPGAVHICTSNIIQVFSYLILIQIMAVGSVAMPTQDTAFMLAVAFAATFVLLANFLIRWQEITWDWVAALRFVSPLYFAFGSLVENEFKGRAFPCPPELGVQCISEGGMIVSLYTDYSLGTTMGVLAAWWLGLMATTYGAMLWRIKQLTGKWRNR